MTEPNGQHNSITDGMLRSLPEPVRRYMRYTGVVGKRRIDSVRLKQIGRFRPGPERPWMSMRAEQYFTTDPPGFVWNAGFRSAGLPLLRARDVYNGGAGHMRARLAGLVTLFDVRGEKLDQGAMLRYLSEMLWFPTSFLGDNITWHSIDDRSAGVTFEDRGRCVCGRMFFDDIGRPVDFTARRHRAVGDEFSLDSWSTPISGYACLAGLNLPVRAQAVWHLPSGDLPYADLEITEIHYDPSN